MRSEELEYKVKYLEPLKEQILELDNKNSEFFVRVLAATGIVKKLPLPIKLFTTYFFALLYRYKRILRASTLSLAKDLSVIFNHLGDPLNELENYRDPELLEAAIDHTRYAYKLDGRVRDRVIASLTLLAEALSKLQRLLKYENINDVILLTQCFRATLLELLPMALPHSEYHRRAYYIGLLIKERNATSMEKAIEILRIALATLPSSTAQVVDQTLYFTIKLLSEPTKDVLRLLHCPLDSDLLKVMKNIGVVDRATAPDFNDKKYHFLQNLARSLNPEDPTILYGLSYIGRVLCRKKLCHECPFSLMCRVYL
ncbi:MAG: hypothetical protein DRJ40_01185 [Thermoprotei archaeon]|nr:MAG: hypothetical protein DRJ40_01185 [Thermoprotei archaeon]